MVESVSPVQLASLLLYPAAANGKGAKVGAIVKQVCDYASSVELVDALAVKLTAMVELDAPEPPAGWVERQRAKAAAKRGDGDGEDDGEDAEPGAFWWYPVMAHMEELSARRHELEDLVAEREAVAAAAQVHQDAQVHQISEAAA